ncbi:hypothetical protein N9937_00655 [bacterium]|nr:hypothetical protein [bacterium]
MPKKSKVEPVVKSAVVPEPVEAAAPATADDDPKLRVAVGHMIDLFEHLIMGQPATHVSSRKIFLKAKESFEKGK